MVDLWMLLAYDDSKIMTTTNSIHSQSPTFAQEEAPPPSDRIADDLFQKISLRVYKKRLPSGSALAKSYQVNVKTVVKAIEKLVQKGLVYRVHGKGTFIRHDSPPVVSPDTPLGEPPVPQAIVSHTKLNAAILMRTDPHLYESLIGKINEVIHERNMSYPAFFDLMLMENSKDPASLLTHILDMRPDHLIVEGQCPFPFDALQPRLHELKHLIFLLYKETGLDMPSDAVLMDSWHGAYIATKHLLEQGHENMLMVTYDMELSPHDYRHTHNYNLVSGYSNACEAFSPLVKSQVLRLGTDLEANRLRFQEIFSRSDHPTGVFVSGDYWAALLLRQLDDMDVSVPDDLSLVGYFDTPWCDWCKVPLTSVSICPDQIAQGVEELLAEGRATGRTIFVKPKLIVRQSSVKT